MIVTAPGYITSTIFGGENGLIPEASLLKNINYPPVASVTLAYPNEAFKVKLIDDIYNELFLLKILF